METGLLWLSVVCLCAAGVADEADLTHAVVVTRAGERPPGERTAVAMLVEEVQKRTGLQWPTTTQAADKGLDKGLQPLVEVAVTDDPAVSALQPEGYRLSVETNANQTVVRIHGADARAVLYGVGHFLRRMRWETGAVRFPKDVNIVAKPALAIRGHQLGYRATANSYDAWDVKQYDQYIRELVIFGANTVEDIPFQDSDSPVMPVPRPEMNVKISAICDRYDVDYWIWTPADFDLKDTAKRAAELDRWEALYRACPRLDAVFFPGGDPGDNPPDLVIPFLEEAAQRLAKHHPKAGMWISLQGFEKDAVDYFYKYVDEHAPQWLTGVVSGPSSPPIIETRRRLPARYRLRMYPDITHTVLCQYPVPWWDPAFAFTLGREPVNPRPRFHAQIVSAFAPHADGFSTYSDGINDDVNKTMWSRLGWDWSANVRDILIDYCRFFFRPDLATDAADGILALESNWEGALATNGGVEATHALWSQLAQKAPELKDNWRWRCLTFRAAYDAFVRRRLEFETSLEDEANRALADAKTRGADAAMDAAMAILKRAGQGVATGQGVAAGQGVATPCLELRARLEADGDALFKLIGFQTSVERYHAKGFERGAVLDFLDRPLNNRWWLEDEFTRIRALPSEAEKVARLETIRAWEHPGAGSCYDDVGNVAKSPHVMRGEGVDMDPEMTWPLPGYGTWMDNGRSRWRLSWLSSMDWPLGMVYDGLDPSANYVVRLTGRGDALLRINGERVEPSAYSKNIGEFKEFPVPKDALKQGKIVLTWDKPDEGGINWRQASFLAEAWLLKR